MTQSHPVPDFWVVWSKRRIPFHLQSCRWAHVIREHNRMAGAAADAVGHNRRPCMRCKPPRPVTPGRKEGAAHVG